MDAATASFLATDATWVPCPSARCTSGASMTDGHIFTCQVCSYRYCTSCDIPMHENESCTEHRKRLTRDKEKVREEHMSVEFVKKVSKPCPGCKRNLDKYEGCDHVTCKLHGEPGECDVLLTWVQAGGAGISSAGYALRLTLVRVESRLSAMLRIRRRAATELEEERARRYWKLLETCLNAPPGYKGQ